MRATAFAVPANRLLAALPRALYRGLFGKLESVPFELGVILYEAGESPRYVYFPSDSMVSLIGATRERNQIEVGLVGHEGMVGYNAVMGASASPTGALVQGAGSAMRMPLADFSRSFERHAALRREVLRCASVQMAMAVQVATCNNAHTLQARLARWLLMTRDRLGSSRFPMTQSFLSKMLGTRRATVNGAARTLQRANLITYSRGRITIRDLDGLSAAACSCYEDIRQLTARRRSA
jgi:CRP-like cAMP-binding protein